MSTIKFIDDSDAAILNQKLKTKFLTKLDTSLKGANNGLAELDASGKIPTSQLPSYVDDVVEYASTSAFPSTGESGVIYIALDTNKTYRWSGSGYVEISESLALGETSSTAYRGDRGKTAYDHATDSSRLTTAQASGLYKIATTNEGHIASTAAVTKTDITDLGIPAQDTTYTAGTNVTINASNEISATDTTYSNFVGTDGITAGAAGLVPAPATTDNGKYLKANGTWDTPAGGGGSSDYNDLSNKPSINNITISGNKTSADLGLDMVILSYGSSTWQDFIDAYNRNAVVYCRASSNIDPASGSQTRLAFMAYVNDETNPTSVEFQYYRSIDQHTNTDQGDQVFVYELDNTDTWTVTKRATYSKIVAGSHLTYSYSSGKLTLSAGPEVELDDNKVTSISSSSTDTQYPSAKCVYDALQNKITYGTTDLTPGTSTLATGNVYFMYE